MLLAEVAQLVEHGTENAGVDSSILSLGTTRLKAPLFTPTYVVECPGVTHFADILPTLVPTTPLS